MTNQDFEAWQAELADADQDAATATVVDGEVVADTTDDGPVLVDSVEAQRNRRPGMRGRTAAERLPVVPEWARSRASVASEAKRVLRYAGHVAGFHAVRVPLYAAKIVGRAPVGLWRWGTTVMDWLTDAEARPVRAATVRKEDYEAYRKLVVARDRHVRWRGIVVTATGVATVAGAVAVGHYVGEWPLWLAGGGTAMAAGLSGRPADQPLLATATVKTSLAPLTSDVVIRGLSVLGISGINQAVAKTGDRAIEFTAPITRDGPGWRAEVNLPYGVTAGDVADRRDRLASGLSRPLGCVWPEGRPEVTPGRLVIWVGDEDMATSRQPKWPLLRGGSVDLFKAFPFGTDPRGNWVGMDVLYTNVLIGSIPGMGKTFSLRVPLLAAALDPRAELWIYELKGTGDLDAVGAAVATRFASGADDPEIEQALQALRDLRVEIARRAKVIKGLPKDVCPENKVTPELASRKSLGLHPLLLSIDECQELFSHPEYGAEAAELAEKCIKLGRALGVILFLATQRPDAKSLPTGVSANVGTRYCLRVMGQLENDMILGTSSYKNGVRATMFTGRDKGVGYLVGQSDDAQIVKTAYIDNPTAERICARARAARAAAGTLTGYAAGDTTTKTAEKPRFDLLADLMAVFPVGDTSAWNSDLVTRLVELRPDHYGHRWAELGDDTARTGALTAALKEIKADQIVGQVGRRDGTKTINRRGIHRDKLREIITLRDGKTGPN